MMRDTDDAIFGWSMGNIAIIMVMSIATIMAASYSLIAAVAAIVVWGVLELPLALAVSVWFWGPVNIGPTYRFGDSRLFALLRRLAAVQLSECGCLYAVYMGNPKGRSGSETLESDKVWLRQTDGARVKYHEGREEYRRCYDCGNRYMTTEKGGWRRNTETYWKDDPEPFPDDEREVVELET